MTVLDRMSALVTTAAVVGMGSNTVLCFKRTVWNTFKTLSAPTLSSAPCHPDLPVSDWFQHPGIRVVEWTGLREINPTENLWVIVKRKIVGKNFSTKAAVFQAVYKARDEVSDMSRSPNSWKHAEEVPASYLQKGMPIMY